MRASRFGHAAAQRRAFAAGVQSESWTAGWRRCDLLGGQNVDGKVLILFNVYDYSYVRQFSFLALILEDDERKRVPIHISRLDPAKRALLARREEGIRLVRGRIKEAVGESRDQQRCADKQEEV